MNDLIHSLFISHPPAPARGGPDPLLPVRRSFGEGDHAAAPLPPRLRRRAGLPLRPKRALART